MIVLAGHHSQNLSSEFTFFDISVLEVEVYHL